MRGLLLPGWLLAVLAGLAPAQDAVRIEGPGVPAPGSSYVVEASRRWKESTRVELDGRVLHEEEAALSLAYVARVEVVSPDESRIAFEKAEFEDSEGKRELGLAGRTVLARRVDGQVEFTIGDAPVPDAALDLLRADFARPRPAESLLPDRPVAPGDTWELSLETATARLGLEWDDFRGRGFTATARLDGLSEQDGRRVARIEVLLDAEPETMGRLDLSSSQMRIEATLQVPVDSAGPWSSFEATASLEALGAPERGTHDVLTEYSMDFERREVVRP